MIKILFFIPKLSGGGAEKVLRNLVNNMDQSKFDITVQTIEKEDSEKYLSTGIRYKSINNCKTAIGKKLFDYWIRICAELKIIYPLYMKGDYDIEVAYLECGATKMLAHSTNKKAVKLAWVHCDLSKKEGMEKSIEKVRKQYQKYDEIICVSEGVQVGFQQLCGNGFETKVIYNVIDEQEILKKADEPLNEGVGKGRINLLAIGRLSEEKNFSYLINTCKQLYDYGNRFKLNILGDGPEYSMLKAKINELELDDVIELKGFIENPYSWIKASDIVVCSSKYEGLSTVVQEAFIVGKPVVTTPCAGMQELLGNSEYGIIADDTEEGLYNSLNYIMNNPSIMKHYGEMARERQKEFSRKKILIETESYFLNKVMVENKE